MTQALAGCQCQTGPVPRFLTLADVCETLNIKMPQARSLVRSGELRAIQVGGRNVWRVEEVELEAYIARMYERAADQVGSAEHADAEPAGAAETNHAGGRASR